MEQTSRTGDYNPPSFPTAHIAVYSHVSGSLTRYLQDLALQGLRPSTLHGYSLILHSFIIAAAAVLTVDAIRAYLVSIQGSVSPATLYLRARLIRRFAEYCGVDCSRLPQVHPPTLALQRRLFASADDVTRLLAYQRERYRQTHTHWRLRDLAVTALLFGAGLRIGEVVGLRVQDVDVARREVYLKDTKTKRPRLVPVPPSVVAVLRLYLIVRSCLARDTDRLFLCEDWRPVSAQRLSLMLRAAGRAVGCTISTHTGRRFCITQLAYRAGVYVAMTQVGHTHLSTTQRYLQVDMGKVKEAVRRFDPLRAAG
jgi:integrase